MGLVRTQVDIKVVFPNGHTEAASLLYESGKGGGPTGIPDASDLMQDVGDFFEDEALPGYAKSTKQV